MVGGYHDGAVMVVGGYHDGAVMGGRVIMMEQ